MQGVPLRRPPAVLAGRLTTGIGYPHLVWPRSDVVPVGGVVHAAALHLSTGGSSSALHHGTHERGIQACTHKRQHTSCFRVTQMLLIYQVLYFVSYYIFPLSYLVDSRRADGQTARLTDRRTGTRVDGWMDG